MKTGTDMALAAFLAFSLAIAGCSGGRPSANAGQAPDAAAEGEEAAGLKITEGPYIPNVVNPPHIFNWGEGGKTYFDKVLIEGRITGGDLDIKRVRIGDELHSYMGDRSPIYFRKEVRLKKNGINEIKILAISDSSDQMLKRIEIERSDLRWVKPGGTVFIEKFENNVEGDDRIAKKVEEKFTAAFSKNNHFDFMTRRLHEKDFDEEIRKINENPRYDEENKLCPDCAIVPRHKLLGKVSSQDDILTINIDIVDLETHQVMSNVSYDTDLRAAKDRHLLIGELARELYRQLFCVYYDKVLKRDERSRS